VKTYAKPPNAWLSLWLQQARVSTRAKGALFFVT